MLNIWAITSGADVGGIRNESRLKLGLCDGGDRQTEWLGDWLPSDC